MPIPALQPLFIGSLESRVEALRILLGYPLKLRDPQGSRFWYVRPGADTEDAENTCPIAVGFYKELSTGSERELKTFLTDDQQQKEIYGHYTKRTIPDRPVMYLLLPEGEAGSAALILPTEGRLRQQQIQIFALLDQDFQARLNRLRQSELQSTKRFQEGILATVPLVEWAFYKPIETAKELAQQLAKVSREIEEKIPEIYDKEHDQGYLHNLLLSFQRELLPTLKLKAGNDKDYSFADIYAQTIAYGLFTARVFGHTVAERKQAARQDQTNQETDFNRQNAWSLLPETNPFLRRLFRDVSLQTSDELGDELTESISELISILRAAKMDAILADFRAKMNREDIIIHFYEDFLAAYKPKMRQQRGVYYTPEPVVSYMVRSVDILLKEKFNKPFGIADPEVMILDPACGTGTFLLDIFKRIHKRFQEFPEALTEGLQEKSWSAYVRERLLPRIFGFELLMAPYAIAHLKLGLFLEETGYQFNSGKRLGVYLTNTLEEATRKSETLLEEFIAEEADQAALIKKKELVMVVIGNPPYSIHSQNLDTKSRRIVDAYRFVDGKKIKEKGALQFEKNIQNDYIKFFRFSQTRIETTGFGVLAFVTDHSFLNSPTFRGMRQSILQTFNDAHIVDLHGNSLKNEQNPEGGKDENVFDIQQGVTISILSKTFSPEEAAVKHLELWGTRELKYYWLLNNNFCTENISQLKPSSPTYLLIPEDQSFKVEYQAGFLLTEIMPKNSAGVITARNHVVIDFDQDTILKNATLFRDSEGSDEEVCSLLDIPPKKGWNIEKARRLIKREKELNGFVKKIMIQPFDSRYIFYHPSLVWGMSLPTMRHMIGEEENLSLLVTRQTKESFGTFVSSQLSAHKLVSVYDTNSVFPLRLYPDTNDLQALDLGYNHRPNFSQRFLDFVHSKLSFMPPFDEIFYYIYSILHSPTYRTRYAEFLKTDFPRIPFTSDISLFQKLAGYGEELVSLHLMKSPKLDVLITEFEEKEGNRVVDPGHPKYSDERVVINKKGAAFVGVPEEMWNFYIGGYQVCQKWLKDRKGRALSDEDIRHYQRIVVALQETMVLIEKIDEAIPGFPIV